MSGGSFEYVSVTDDIETLRNRLDSLRRLRDALAEYEGSGLAVAETDLFINRMMAWDEVREIQRQELYSSRFQNLQNVWKAVEWVRSSDWLPGSVGRALDEYRKAVQDELPPMTLNEIRTHLRQRLNDIDTCKKQYCGGSCCSHSVTDELTEVLALLARVG